MHPQSGFSLDPQKQTEPIKAPEKKKGLMVQPQPPQKTILGMKYEPPKPAEQPKEDEERNWFLEGLLGDDYTTKFSKHPTPDDPFLKGLYGVEEPKHHTDEPNMPQKFISKTQPIDKFMGVTPSAPFDRPLDKPDYSQPVMPPKPEGGKPKDYIHNPDGKKTYDFRNPKLSAVDYVFGKDFKPVEWKQGIDSGGKLGYDGNKDVGKIDTNGYINEPKNWENELHNSIKARVDALPSTLSDEDRAQWIDSIILDEAGKLQKKYRTVYYGSNNMLTSIFSPGLHNNLKPLFTEYPTEETQTDPLFDAATNGLSAGFKAGLWAEALKGISPEGAGSSTTRTFTSPDKYVGETATQIESQFPKRVVGVNKKVPKPDGSTLTDFDIELDNVVIQVKSGTGKKLTSQMIRTQSGTTKTVIGYTPDLNPSSALVKGAEKSGFKVFTSWEDLLNYLLNN